MILENINKLIIQDIIMIIIKYIFLRWSWY